MKVLITGSKGFIAKNLIEVLKAQNDYELLLVDIDTPKETLDTFCQICDFVFHFAGVNRSPNPTDFSEGNYEYSKSLIDLLKKHKNFCPIVFSSSIQAEENNPYGQSKKMCEDLLLNYAKTENAPIIIYRLPNIYGRWCRPNYNSFIATLCYNMPRNLPFEINNEDRPITLVYVNDLVNELISVLNNKNYKTGFYNVNTYDKTTIREVVDILCSFKDRDMQLINLNSHLKVCLYATYVSYLPLEELTYNTKYIEDQRGSFSELLHFASAGQISINIINPGMIKGNHYHNLRIEKFIVIKGKCLFKLRKIDSNQIISYELSDAKLQIIDIPIGYTHSIVNIGDEKAIMLIWSSINYNKDDADTYHLDV